MGQSRTERRYLYNIDSSALGGTDGPEGGVGRVKRVFISHPFSSDPEGNRVRVDIICHDLVKQGILPISPLHLFSFMENDDKREEILQVCFRLIDICDEVWIYGDSEGCKKEREYALSRGKKVLNKCGDQNGEAKQINS